MLILPEVGNWQGFIKSRDIARYITLADKGCHSDVTLYCACKVKRASWANKRNRKEQTKKSKQRTTSRDSFYRGNHLLSPCYFRRCFPDFTFIYDSIAAQQYHSQRSLVPLYIIVIYTKLLSFICNFL